MIQIDHLTKRYGGTPAVDDVTFAAHPGRVTGFLGANGAGKSTVMRVVCGFARATSGTTLVLGRPYVALPEPRRHVGLLLDPDMFHPGRTGVETLRLAAALTGVPSSRVTSVLDTVHLSPADAGKQVRGYSLGMRQRLGLAQALLGEPEVLILDEPTNGLDPTGILWLRTLVRQFADDGGTVLLSSHMLGEVQSVADDIVMIARGRLIAAGPTADLLHRGSTVVTSADDNRLSNVLDVYGVPWVRRLDGRLTVDAAPERVGHIALAAGVVLHELTTDGIGSLEDLFLDLTTTEQVPA